MHATCSFIFLKKEGLFTRCMIILECARAWVDLNNRPYVRARAAPGLELARARGLIKFIYGFLSSSHI
jgi:hypothetical protein